MKKILLSAVALAATMSANAQVEIAAVTEDVKTALVAVIGEPTIDDGKGNITYATIPAGTKIMETTNTTLTAGLEDAVQWTGLSKNDVKVGEADFGSTTGLQGKTNAPASACGAVDAEGNVTPAVYPEKGWILHFDVKANGYLYVIHKASANKNYVVWENKARIPYIYSAVDGGSYDLNKIDGATQTSDGIITLADNYVIQQAQKIIGTDGKGAGTCVIAFPVYEGCFYDVHATGSKITTAGYIFEPNADSKGTLTITSGETTLISAGGISTGIENVKSNKVIDINSAIYNIAGQKVANDYKGLVIKDGKKMILK